MTSDINVRLNRLSNRRKGVVASLTEGYDGLDAGLLSADRQVFESKNLSLESWEQKASGKPATRYALGAMQAVDKEYTEISKKTAERVQNQLRSRLGKAGILTDFRLQGSVPLDIHIKGISDVDLLLIDTSFFTYSPHGSKAQRGGYHGTQTSKTSVGVLSTLRREAEAALKAAYPAAQVSCDGAKAIKLSNGSLQRDVDVVPSHWFDTEDYQRTMIDDYRGVEIFDKTNYQTLENSPFLHINRIIGRCSQSKGGLRKAIRLCKNIKADLVDEGRKFYLSSYDIAALLYHANITALQLGDIYDLAILSEVQRFLDYLYQNPLYAGNLITPDGSRKILDTEDKKGNILTLSVAVDSLAAEVKKENLGRSLDSILVF